MTNAYSEAKIARNAAGNYEFLTYKLGAEDYGVDILKVQEIRGYDAGIITVIANAPASIKGVVNLRGAIVPIIDMRVKLNLGEVAYNDSTVVIILNLESQVVGMVVDSVQDVITMTESQIKPAPNMGASIDTAYVTGMGTIDDRMVILVDIDKLMSAAELVVIEAVAA